MKTVLVTGANRGIGLGFCEHYARQGWRVLAACRDSSDKTALGAIDNLEILNLDLSLEESIQGCAHQVSALGGGVDLLINNAGIARDQVFGEWTQDAFMQVFQTNAVGPALLIQALIDHLNAGAKIIQLSSGLGSIAENINPGGPFEAYAMSKASLNVLSKRLSSTLLSSQIALFSISPGWVRTDMGGSQAPASVTEAVQALSSTIEKLSLEQSGGFFDELGVEIPF